jgi:hypothetical protein
MNEQLAPLFERLARRAPAQRLLRWMGLDPKQFVLFLGLLRTLSEREEFMGVIGVDRFSLSFLAILLAVLGGAYATLTVAAQTIPAPAYLMIQLAITFVMIVVFIGREAANALFDPVEASILSHAPVHSPTYTAAKIAHVMIAVLYIVSALSVYPALIGVLLKGTHWFWPITHLLAAFSTGFWTAFLICAFYGLVGRFAPKSWIKGISILMQLLAPVLFTLFSTIMFLPSKVLLQFVAAKVAWLPLTWFAGVGMLGCQGMSWKLGWQGALSILATIIIVWLGLRSFSAKYFLETSSILEGASWHSGRGRAVSRWCMTIARLLTGSPLGLGAFCFVSKMIRRDWQYRRAVMSLVVMPVFALLGILFTIICFGFPAPPISSVHPSVSAFHVLPHLLGIIAATLAINIPFTNFHDAAWIYLATPMASLRAFARGIYWALWIPAGLIYIVFLPFMIRFWGWWEAILVVVYSLIVISLYLSFAAKMIPMLPFSTQLNEMRNVLKSTHIQMCYMSAIPLGAVQYYSFSSWGIAILSGIVLAIAVWFVVQWSFGELAKEFAWRLHQMKTGPNQMFKEIE